MGKLTFGATGGLSYQVDKVSIGNRGAPTCPRCNDRVYFNEERRAVGKSWHIKCFNCVKCKKKLDSTTMASHEEEIYCRHCHKKEFGPKGYGFAGGAAGLAAEYKPPSSSSAPSATTSDEDKPASAAPGAPITATNPALAPKFMPDSNDPNSCPRCGKKVYFAEEIKALGKKFHRLCFKCGSCNKMLEPGRCSTHENELFCNNCYGRKYGPKGYGFAGGAGTMLAPDVETLAGAGPAKQGIIRETELTKKKRDPISRQQHELVESRPTNLASGIVYGASNSIFDSRKVERRASPLPQDQQNVVLVPHDRTRFSPNPAQEEMRKSPAGEGGWSAEEFRRSPMPQEQPVRSQSNISPAFQEPPKVVQTSPVPPELRTSPADRSYSPKYGNSLHPDGVAYGSNNGSVEELSRYNDPASRYQPVGQQGGPSPIHHLVSNMYTRSEYQKPGYTNTTGEAETRPYHSVEDLSSPYIGYNGSAGAVHAKSASIDGSAAYNGVGSDAAIAAAIATARAQYGHVSEVPDQPQYGHSTGPTIRHYQPEPQYSKNDFGPPPNATQTSYGQEGGYNPQYQPSAGNESTPYSYEYDYRNNHQPPSYNQLGSEAYSHSNAHGYRGQNEHSFSSAVDAVFSKTMPTVHQ